MPQRIAVVGGGVAGLCASYWLSRRHQVTLFEAEPRLGGHVDTHQVTENDREIAVDSGFIVFNHAHYPLFSGLLEELDVASQPSCMSFSVRDDHRQLEYCALDFRSLFAQQRNLVRPAFLRMLVDITRFYRQAPKMLRESNANATLADLRRSFGNWFLEAHLIPMASALWSTPQQETEGLSLRHVLQFMNQHAMLDLRNRPEWRTVAGGSATYVRALIERGSFRLHVSAPVQAVHRHKDGSQVELHLRSSEPIGFDAVVLACHADQALAMLTQPTEAEREVLGSFSFAPNDMVLHTDASVMPRRRNAWASWNVWTDAGTSGAAITYHMNRLQQLRAAKDYFVSLNLDQHIAADCRLAHRSYRHPQFTPEAERARARHDEISGVQNTYYAGAYWGFGFHEDGVRSAKRVVDQIAA